MNYLNDLLQWLDKIQGLPAVALVFISCIAVGYVLRGIKSFPNQAIPTVVVLWGMVAMLFIADPRASTMPARIWTARNTLVGLAIGFFAWLAHKYLLKKFENWIAKKFDLGDTNFFDKSAPPKDPP